MAITTSRPDCLILRFFWQCSTQCVKYSSSSDSVAPWPFNRCPFLLLWQHHTSTPWASCHQAVLCVDRGANGCRSVCTCMVVFMCMDGFGELASKYLWPWTTKPVCSNSQKYTACVKIIYFSFMPKVKIMFHEDIWSISYRKYIKTSFLISYMHC